MRNPEGHSNFLLNAGLSLYAQVLHNCAIAFLSAAVVYMQLVTQRLNCWKLGVQHCSKEMRV